MPEPTRPADRLPRPDVLEIPFELRGTYGVMHVTVGPDDQPQSDGHALVASDFDPVTFRGFPYCLAELECSQRGLLVMAGWVQTIRRFDANDVECDFAVDRFPLGPDDSPLYTYGHLPTFYDAPANPSDPDGVWQADAWLVAIPDIIRSRTLYPIAGFRWGYRLRAGKPTLLVTRRLSRYDWVRLIPQLAMHNPRWELLEYPPKPSVKASDVSPLGS